MRVDVLIAGNPPGGNATEGSRVRTLLQNIQVLSAGEQIQKDAEGKPLKAQVVNLLVTPQQAEVLSLAGGDQTRIQLVLRNPLDTEVTKTPGSAMARLFTDPNAPVPIDRPRVARPKPEPKPEAKPLSPGVYLVEVLNGSKRSEAKFAAEESK
jgi:pilus assembly protein CpaB